jgi:hypothetical protein
MKKSLPLSRLSESSDVIYLFISARHECYISKIKNQVKKKVHVTASKTEKTGQVDERLRAHTEHGTWADDVHAAP